MTIPRVVIVTGTDTGVGKTVVTAALGSAWSARGTVAVYKPAQTGVRPDEPGDIDEVRRLSGLEDVHEGIRLRDPLAPDTAARREGVALPTMKQHAETVGDLLTRRDLVLVEGAGGLLVGLDVDGHGLSELAEALAVPSAFVVVVRAGLGTLNHAALTVEALRARNLTTLGLVVGAYPGQPNLAERTNLEDLPAMTGVPIIGRVPERAAILSPDEFRSSARSWFEERVIW